MRPIANVIGSLVLCVWFGALPAAWAVDSRCEIEIVTLNVGTRTHTGPRVVCESPAVPNEEMRKELLASCTPDSGLDSMECEKLANAAFEAHRAAEIRLDRKGGMILEDAVLKYALTDSEVQRWQEPDAPIVAATAAWARPHPEPYDPSRPDLDALAEQLVRSRRDAQE